MGETQLKEKVLKMFKKEYPDAWVYKTNDRFTSGIPDLLITYQGKSFAIELKAGKNKATPLQKSTLKKLHNAGASVGICYTVDECREVMERYNF